jgi:hypothetical protein
MHPIKLFADFGHELRRVVVGATDEHTKFRKRLATLVLLTLVIDLSGSGLMRWFEHGKTDSEITSFFKSFFWVTTQLLTVSSQMKNPVTTPGRIVDIFLEIWAITVVATVAASFATFLQKK